MNRNKEQNSVFPKSPLREAIDFTRDEGVENLSLQMKLQLEMAKPANEQVCQAAGDIERITKLKAEQLSGSKLLSAVH